MSAPRPRFAILFLAALLAIPTGLAGQSSPPPAQEPPADRGMEEEELDAPPPEPVPAEPGTLEARAAQAYSEGDLPAALGLYRQAAERAADPKEKARHLVTAAWLGFQLGDPTAARGDLERALFADPATPFRAELYTPDFVALQQDALAAAVAQRRRTAIERLNQAIEEIAAKRYEAARALLLEGLALSPDDPDGVYNLAVVDLRTGNREAALAGFERVLALERGNPEGVSRELKSQALNNAAVIYFQLEQYADAETALAEAVRLDPGDGKAWFNLGLTRARLGKQDEAFAAFRRAREIDPRDVDVARQLGLAHIARQDWVEAAAILGEATRAEPESADLWMHLGRAQRGLGDVAGALASFDRAIALDPGNRHGYAEPAALLAAETRLAQRDFPGAAAAAERAAGWKPAKPDGWMLLGLARYEAGDLAGAREALERAAEAGPRRADVAHNLGTVYLAEKDVASAEAQFRRALELDPASPGTAEVLAQIEQRKAAATPEPGGRRAKRELGAQLSAVDVVQLGLRGLAVEAVTAGSAAARAGLTPGDLVLRADGRAVATPGDLEEYVARARRAVELEILRQGRPLTLTVTLD